MNSGTIYKVRDIVLANITFSDQTRMKKRPVLIIDRIEYNDYIICPITSNIGRSGIPVGPEDENLRKPSVILPYILKTIHINNIDKKIGELSFGKYFIVLIWIFRNLIKADAELDRYLIEP